MSYKYIPGFLRNVGGRPRIFKTPQELLDQACDYFEWSEKNKIIDDHGRARTRPLSLRQLSLFLNISNTTWYNMKKNPEFEFTCEQIESWIFSQQANGAALGIFNANLISRILGLEERQHVITAPPPKIGNLEEHAERVMRKFRELHEKEKQQLPRQRLPGTTQ